MTHCTVHMLEPSREMQIDQQNNILYIAISASESCYSSLTRAHLYDTKHELEK